MNDAQDLRTDSANLHKTTCSPSLIYALTGVEYIDTRFLCSNKAREEESHPGDLAWLENSVYPLELSAKDTIEQWTRRNWRGEALRSPTQPPSWCSIVPLWEFLRAALLGDHVFPTTVTLLLPPPILPPLCYSHRGCGLLIKPPHQPLR